MSRYNKLNSYNFQLNQLLIKNNLLNNEVSMLRFIMNDLLLIINEDIKDIDKIKELKHRIIFAKNYKPNMNSFLYDIDFNKN